MIRSKICHNTTFTWLEHELPSTKSRHIIGAQCRGSYWYRVTVYPYNGYIGSTNLIKRHIMSLTWTMKRIYVNEYAPKHAATQPLHGSNTPARAPNLVTSQNHRRQELKIGPPTPIMLQFGATALQVLVLIHDAQISSFMHNRPQPSTN